MIFNRATIIKLTLFVVLLSNLVLKSQTIVTIGSNTTTVNTERYPFNGYYDFGWSSQIYLSSEVAGSGTITAVSFSVTNSPVNYTMTAQKIYVRHTSASSYTNSTYPGISGFTLVYDGNIVYNGNEWKSISFSTPFIYDGTSNLEFLFENRDGTYTSGFPYFAYTTSTGSNRLKRDYKDGSFPSTCANCSALNNILNIRIAKACSVFPVVSVSSTNSIVCNNNAINLIASGASTYSWTPSVGLNLTTGATVTANPSSNTIYTVTGTTSGCSAIATTTVAVNNLNTGTAIAAGSGNRCNNAQVNLSLDSKSSLTIGTGTLNTEKYPFNGYSNFSWSDVIYTQSELGASGTISKIAFFVDNAPSAYTMNNQLIYIRNTSSQSFTNTSYPGISGFTQVFNGTITYNGAGWKEITFSTPYNYNGIDNLEILYENRDGSFSSGFPTFRNSVASANRVKIDFRDASFPSTCVNCASFSNIPNTRFTIDRALNNFVKWQSSLDGINYTDIPNGSTANFSTTAKSSTYYRAEVNNANCSAYSTPAYYITNSNFYVNDNSLTGDIYTTAVGSNSNSGLSPGSPKASISAILNTYTLSSCDTIFVDKGTYIDEVVINAQHSGNNQGFVVISGAGVDASILNAATNKNNISLNQVDYIKIEKFTLNSTQSNYNNIKLQGAEQNDISGNKFIHSVSSNIVIFGDNSKANNNKIYSNVINNNSTNGYGITVEGNADTISIYGNTITMSNNTGLAAIYVTSYYASSTNFYPAHGAIYQNTISAQNYGVKLHGPDYSISTYTLNNNIITINTKSSTDGAGIWLGSVGASSSDKSIIYSNKIFGGSNGIYFSGFADYVRIYNNYISGSDNGILVSSSSSDIGEIYFNSFYNSTNNLYFTFSSAAYWKIKNNIFYNTNSSTSNACIRIGNTGVTFDACDYNLFFAPSGASVGRLSSTNYTTLASWKNVDHADETPKGDENSIYGNPLYVNEASNNLDVTSSSPAAASGTVISGITTDIYNTTRSNPTFIGAQEIPFSVAICNTQTITCAIPSATLTGTTASNGVSFSWVGPTAATPAGSSPSSSLTIVSAAGIYTLTATKSGNTPITLTVQVVSNQTLPNVSVGTNQTITASVPSVTLTGSSSTSGVSYSWTPGGSAPTNSATIVSTGGVYTLSITDPVNGCVASSTVLVVAHLSVAVAITDYENDSIKGSVNISISGGSGPYKIEWDGKKIPDVNILLNALSSYSTSLVIDTVRFKHYADSISKIKFYSNLIPGMYPFKIFDSFGDSIAGVAVVGSKINWGAKEGILSQDDTISSRSIGNIRYYYATAQQLIQTGSFSLGNNYAVSTNFIDSRFNNHIEFTNPDNKQIIYAGLAIRDTNIVLTNTAKTYFEFTGASNFKIHFLDSVIYTGDVISGDVFSIDNDIETGEISYSKNGMKLISRAFSRLNPDQGLLFKVLCGSVNSRLANIVSINASAYSSNYLIGNVTDVTCFSPSSGTIDVYPFVQGSVFNLPISYELYKVTASGNILVNTINGPFTSSAHGLFQNLSAGKYEVKYTGFAYFLGFPTLSIPQVSFSSFFDVAYKPDWVSNTNVSISSNSSLKKISGVTNSWDAGASSINTLLNNDAGWIEWTASSDQNINSIGFSASDLDLDINTIDYSVGYIRINLGIYGIWNLYVKTKNTTMIASLGITGNGLRSYSVNDKFRLERDANNIVTMYLNGNPIEQFTSPANGSLIIDASLKLFNGVISNPRCSFGCPIVEEYAIPEKKLDGGYYTAHYQKLLLKYNEEYKDTDGKLKFNIYNDANVIVYSSASMSSSAPTVLYGDNRYTIDLANTSYYVAGQSMPNNKFYILEVINEKNEKWYLRFKK